MDKEFEELCNKIRELNKVIDERQVIIQKNQEILDGDEVDGEERDRLLDETVDLVMKNSEDMSIHNDLLRRALFLQNQKKAE